MDRQSLGETKISEKKKKFPQGKRAGKQRGCSRTSQNIERGTVSLTKEGWKTKKDKKTFEGEIIRKRGGWRG